MKVGLVVLGVLVASPALAGTALEVCNTGGIGLNFRSGPSLHAPIQTAFPEGHDFTRLGISPSGNWIQVRENGSGRVGWVYAAYTCPRNATPRQARQVASRGGGSSAPSSAEACGIGSRIMANARSIGSRINATGGYRFDGYNDCYGFVRRVWDPVLREMGQSPLPVNDVGSSRWGYISDWNDLRPGDVLSTHQGHAWGAQWHGGLYAGKINGVHYIYDNSGSRSAQLRPLPYGSYFRYFYRPTHALTSSACGENRRGGGAQFSRP